MKNETTKKLVDKYYELCDELKFHQDKVSEKKKEITDTLIEIKASTKS